MINESKVMELIKRQKETGLTISAFCINEGIPKSSYNNDYSQDLAELLPHNWKKHSPA